MKKFKPISEIKNLPPEQRSQLVVVWIIRLCMVLAIFLTLSFGDWENFFLSLIALVLSFIPELIESRYKVILPIEFEIVIILFIYASMFLGEAANIYEKIWWWDLFLHGTSGVVLSFAAYLFLYSLYVRRILRAKAKVIACLIFAIALALAAVWEVFEFSVDTIFSTSMQNNSLTDTMTDMITGGIGGLFVAIIGYRHIIHQRHDNIVSLLTKKFFGLNPGLGQKKD